MKASWYPKYCFDDFRTQEEMSLEINMRTVFILQKHFFAVWLSRMVLLKQITNPSVWWSHDFGKIAGIEVSNSTAKAIHCGYYITNSVKVFRKTSLRTPRETASDFCNIFIDEY